jgi:hypothetical protein
LGSIGGGLLEAGGGSIITVPRTGIAPMAPLPNSTAPLEVALVNDKLPEGAVTRGSVTRIAKSFSRT